MTTRSNERIRRAAILVASLDEELAEGLLRTLPEREVDQIYAELESFEEIDPEEQADVLTEFRRRTRREALPASGVEFTPSALAAASVSQPVAPSPAPTPVEPAGLLAGVDHAMLARILTNEHPQTVAAALTRLGAELGAAAFSALPSAMQAEVVDRIANLQPVDDAAVTELESQLMRRVSEWRDREERRTASANLVRKLVAQVAPSTRDTLLGRLRLTMPELATEPAQPWTAASADRRAADLLKAFTATDGDAVVGDGRLGGGTTTEDADVLAEFSADGEDDWSDADEIIDLDDCSKELEALRRRALVDALRTLDQRTVLLALAASSDRIVRSVEKSLSRKNATQLRMMLRTLGPVRLGELRAAQHALLEAARGGVGTGRVAA